MKLLDNKTKIVATIGLASAAPEKMEALLLAGMNVARLNFPTVIFRRTGVI